jgi:mannose-6-phosphate isomerase-like protein (cupin superfamily)
VRDIVGWGALAPVLYFIEYGIGLKPDAPKNELVWRIHSNKRSGCGRFRFNGHVVDLMAEPSQGATRITVKSDGGFVLKVIRGGQEKRFLVMEGRNEFTI